MGVPELDAAGGTVIPGLIDSHVHLQMTPGSLQRSDPPARLRRLRREHLKAYLACGVTTVLDTGVRREIAAEIRTLLQQGHPGPRYLFLGPMLVTPGGYLSGGDASLTGWRVETISNNDELQRALDAFENIGSRGIKVFLEKGFGPREVWPLPSLELRTAVRSASKRRGLPIYVHGSHEDEQRLGLEMGARALVHTGFANSRPSPEFVDRLVGSGTYVITTLSHNDAHLAHWRPERLERPLVQLVVPPTELATASDPESFARLSRATLSMILPEFPGWLNGWIAPLALTEGRSIEMLRRTSAAAARFHEAGVSLVLGSDSGNWPVDPYLFHGPTTLREMELLQNAGLSPREILTAATRTPAEMLGLADQLGTVEVGKRADLVVLEDDPLQDISAVRNIRWTIRNGIAHTPKAWMNKE